MKNIGLEIIPFFPFHSPGRSIEVNFLDQKSNVFLNPKKLSEILTGSYYFVLTTSHGFDLNE